MQRMDRFAGYGSVLQRRPDAWAALSGSRDYLGVSGSVRFYQVRRGVLAAVEASGLPGGAEPCGDNRVLGFHIHSGEECAGDANDPFAEAKGHYNPDNCPHPAHAGDMPPLFSNHGYAFQAFLTDRFSVREIVGKTVIIHAGPDDFTSQPAGAAGARIACGQIKTR